jgi:FlaA1/EpsC-like NDP-sugar epimerase
MIYDTIILGTGGHAYVVTELVMTLNLKIKGFLSNDPEMSEQKFMGYPVLGNDKVLEKMDPNTSQVVIAVSSIGIRGL